LLAAITECSSASKEINNSGSNLWIYAKKMSLYILVFHFVRKLVRVFAAKREEVTCVTTVFVI